MFWDCRTKHVFKTTRKTIWCPWASYWNSCLSDSFQYQHDWTSYSRSTKSGLEQSFRFFGLKTVYAIF